jgi:hypothetical protein
MMKRTVRLKITSTSRQTFWLGNLGLRAHCPVCKGEVEMVTEAQAKGILQVDGLALDRLTAAGRVHTIETVIGNLRVCKDSLFQNRR